MKSFEFWNGIRIGVSFMLLCASSWFASAQPPAIPPNIVTSSAKPMIVLNVSRDHELFSRAYNEYSDIDGDNLPDTTYKHSFDYYGYFDSYKCYSYNGSYFVPSSVTTDKYCSGAWSGNFLNWATMTKMDVLRKILYGGHRSTDTSSSTILERANLPTDTHAFAKFYLGSDLDKLAPFSAEQLAPTRSRNNDDVRRKLAYSSGLNKQWVYPSTVPIGAPKGSCSADVNNYYANAGLPAPDEYNCVWFYTGSAFSSSSTYSTSWFMADLGDQIVAELSSSTNKQMTGTVIKTDPAGYFGIMVTPDGFSVTDTAAYQKSWNFLNLSKRSLTLCNATTPAGGSQWSYNNTNPPLLRVAKGDYQLWAANERWQCTWSEEKSASNGNNFAKTGLGAAAASPSKATNGVQYGGYGPDYIVRVQACVAGLVGKERCKAYPKGNLKPIGLLHEYGETEQAEFALFTGSWAKNVSGGVLRANMDSFKKEVNAGTDGTFTSTSPIVTTLNKLRIYGYRYSTNSTIFGDGTYIGDGNCTFQMTTDVTNGMCTDWGNPLGEIFTESLRYLAGKSPLSSFSFTASGSKDAQLGLPQPAWIDPVMRANETERKAVESKFGRAICRPISAVNFNSSIISFDQELQTAFSTLSTGGKTIAGLVNLIGEAESIHGNKWFVGSNGSNTNHICDAKTVSSLADVDGLCPDGPAYKGTFGIAGAAYWAWTNPIRDDIDISGTPDAFRVKSYNVVLSTSKPRITIKHPTSGKVIELQPSYMNAKDPSKPGAGTLIDFKVIDQSPTHGKYLIIWEDSQQGGDRDQDHAGILRWEIVGDELRVYTSNYAESTSTAQGFGYTLSGSDKDGPHFHTGIEGFSFNDPTNANTTRVTGTANYRLNSSGGCNGCQVGDPESMASYKFVGNAANVLNDPLWYAAKWGGFDKAKDKTKPTSASSWDTKKVDGTAGADGIPDNYFFAIRPAELERSLRTAFEDILASSNTAPAVPLAGLTSGSLKYTVNFDGNDAHGEVGAYALDSNGKFTVKVWAGHEKMTSTAPASRVILTNEGASGVALRWASLSSAARAAMFGTDANAQKRLDWLRGDRSNEAPSGIGLRTRNSKSIMGAVINSNPHLQGRPGAPLFGSEFAGYGDFVKANVNRKPVLWLGSNDGMLHAFDASADATNGGKPLLSYLPQPLQGLIPKWTAAGNTTAMADGSPFTADVKTSAGWATYLFSSLGRGAKGIFALDVTNPANFSETKAADIFRWQFTEANDPDLGYVVEPDNTLSRQTRQAASVAKMNNGKFAVIFGNGVESSNGKAVLYILFVDGPGSGGTWTAGTHYVKLVADAPAGKDNGLSQPLWVDENNDDKADAIYAGDLKGNLWKFNVKGSDVTQWGVAFGGRPLWTAKDGSDKAQPIMTAPTFVTHPKGGTFVMVATGKALSVSDFPDLTRTHSIYGIWDQPRFNLATATATDWDDTTTGLPRARSRLTPRKFVYDTAGSRLVTGDTIDWGKAAGWYVDLTESSELVVNNPVISSLGYLAVVSISPASGASSCSSAPNAFLTLIDPITGLLNEDLLGIIEVVMDDGTKKKGNKATIKLEAGDQSVTLVKDRTEQKDNKGNTLNSPSCLRVVGDKTDLSLCSRAQNRRIQWRELFNFRTKS
ncbi:MAG: hypothetical protein OHK0048_05030 [Rhodoferax sp.]